MQSMTGFGRGAASSAEVEVTCELRSVNQKSLDVKMRLPKEVASLEREIGERVRAAFSRGRIELNLSFSTTGPGAAPVRFDRAAFEAVWADMRSLVDHHTGLEAHARLGDLLRVPFFFTAVETVEIDDSAKALVLHALDAGIADLAASREREGQGLAAVLDQHLARCVLLSDDISTRSADAPARLKERLEARLAALPVDVEPARIAQEVALLAERVDVSEELNRLELHVGHFRKLMAEHGSVGRKLDFLCQELFRETNTIGSKCADAETAHLVVDLKAEIERIREQVQNVE